MNEILAEKIKLYNELDKEIKKIEEQVKNLKQQKEKLGNNIYHELKEKGYDKLTVDGITVYPRTDVYVSLPKESDKSLAWLIERDYGEFIKPYINPRTLTSIIKEYLNEHPEELNEIQKLFNYTEKERIGIRRS